MSTTPNPSTPARLRNGLGFGLFLLAAIISGLSAWQAPSVNIRLYEQKPVLPHWLIERQALSVEMMDELRETDQSPG